MAEADLVEKAQNAKEMGNNHFKKMEYRDAAKCYTKALEICPKARQERAVFLKNRAACWLKLEDYEKALADATSALEITPGDVKSLYRRAQALEAKGNVIEAFKDIKKLLSLEPQNREALESARRLTTAIKKQAETMHSTDSIVNELFTALVDGNTPNEKRIQAAKNFAILSRESSGAERIFQAGGVPRLMPLLDSEIDP